MLKTILCNVFWIALVLTGCGIESIFDSPKSAIAVISAFIVAIVSCVLVLTLDDK